MRHDLALILFKRLDALRDDYRYRTPDENCAHAEAAWTTNVYIEQMYQWPSAPMKTVANATEGLSPVHSTEEMRNDNVVRGGSADEPIHGGSAGSERHHRPT